MTLNIDPKVCEALGKSADEMAEMTIGELCKLAYYRGYDVRQFGWDRLTKGGSLTVTMDSDDRPILLVNR